MEQPGWFFAIVTLALVALPVAVWLDLRNLTNESLRHQASDLNAVISDIRAYYATNVIGRVQDSGGKATPTDKYHDITGGIPIPATLSIELGDVIGKRTQGIKYRFVSDYPFRNRAPHKLTGFEERALKAFRYSGSPSDSIVETNGSVFQREVNMAVPVVMGSSCVSCHNTHPDSPKTDWQVGDIRGIQSITIDQPIAANLFSFKYLLAYLVLAGIAGMTFAVMQWRQALQFFGMNAELEETNSFLATVSMKISKYLSPQVYRSIFSGERDAVISTERKKLTIFFSDIKDFTRTTERLQPEELTALLNEYFTEMAEIAHEHGATVDKFIGDAILAFFGDPETKGAKEDALACVEMAIAMQRRLAELGHEWQRRGIENPFMARIGINTGYCNVGNFGSADRMDYTIIGAEANLAARLESIAEPGGIVMSYETYALVREKIRARAMQPITLKGISREVVPYAVDPAQIAGGRREGDVYEESSDSLRLYVNLSELDAREAEKIEAALAAAQKAVRARSAEKK
ncbi:MAG: adenylate/guanylate cyclase domain-containing protein [Salaquimonas sp.]|nr:adenylate/guanylate cyclase domain-containing protein [Salaquimonas sp.]